VNGMLYGTTYLGGAFNEGTIFSLDPATGTETVLYSFCSQQSCADGAAPEASLINVNGILYGTTAHGGSSAVHAHRLCFGGCGTVFAFVPNTGTETIVHSFCSQLKGNRCEDGAIPWAGLINRDNFIYGTTTNGGRYSGCGRALQCGTVFSIDLSTAAEKTLYTFCGDQDCADGNHPDAGVIDVKGTLYGTTFEGGAYGLGTVFSLKR